MSSSRRRTHILTVVGFAVGVLGFAESAQAHVKWFSEIDWNTTPLTISEMTTPTFWGMLTLTVVALALAVLGDEWASKRKALSWLVTWFSDRSPHSILVIRVAAFATVLVAWQQGTLLTPELTVTGMWVGRFQFLTLVLLLFPRTTSLAGGLFLGLWAYGAARFGLFHMLDYVNAIGVGYFLLVRPLANEKIRNTAIPVLYSTVGFALMWLGCEKLVYPQWALFLLEQKPVLTLGLPPDFFLVAAAFIELGLGFLLIICLFSRALSVTITLVFFVTTCVFGKVEIIGHTLVHASLIVFLLEGHGHAFTPPALFHRTTPMRVAFATVNFSIVLFAMLWAYSVGATRFIPEEPSHHPIHEVAAAEAPTIKLDVIEDPKSGWNIRIATTNFRFTPEGVNGAKRDGEGHAHLYVDERKIARVYSEWFHLAIKEPGEHTIRATLNTNDHADYAIDGRVIEDSVTITCTADSVANGCHEKPANDQH